MAKKIPVAICTTKHKPKRDPKFHITEILPGDGKSTTAPLAILKRGFIFRIGKDIN